MKRENIKRFNKCVSLLFVFSYLKAWGLVQRLIREAKGSLNTMECILYPKGGRGGVVDFQLEFLCIHW